MNDTPDAQDAAKTSGPLSRLPEWFANREVIPLDDQLALVVSHETMRALVSLCRAIAGDPTPVLLTGETGVGKSLLCRFIHASHDPYAPFVAHLTAGLEATVLRERIFGPAAGPPPLALEASGGTLVLEEMGDMPQAVQQALLNFWDAQAKGAAPGPSQWICTTNMPRKALFRPGRMLPEFLGRFRHIHVPPLRERKQDIPALVAYFARLQTSRSDSLKGLETLARRLSSHHFPGNVRELESLMALETGGLPWRWRVTGPDKSCCVRVRRKKSSKQAQKPEGDG